jgi:hypothetical protein
LLACSTPCSLQCHPTASGGEGGSLGLLPGPSASHNRTGGGGAAPQLASRKLVRSGSEAIKQLRNMVGSSGKIYGHLVQLSEVCVCVRVWAVVVVDRGALLAACQ